jgi:hypothetical protein
MADCEVCQPRVPSLSLALWATIMQLPEGCPLTPSQEADILYALEQADEDVATYAGWWPAPTAICEEIPVGIRYGTCLFTRAGASRGVTLRYGKVRAVERVEFLSGARGQGGKVVAQCYTVEPGAVCVVDAEYGAVQLDDRAVFATLQPCNFASIERIRVRYTSGYCSASSEIGAQPFAYLLARHAATYLRSPILCGVDLRGDLWDTFTLTDTEEETTTAHEEQVTHSPSGTTTVVRNETVNRALVTTDQQRYPQNPRDFDSPFGHLPAQVALWRYLRPRRRVKILRV